jgi:hypothetical protein
VADIEPVGRGSQPRRRSGDVERPGPEAGASAGGGRPPRFAGGKVEYGDWQYSPSDAWQLLSPSMREWAEEQAGDPIRDPHTGVPTVYWNCWVRLGPRGPRGAALTATYGLVMFGKRGLVASTGTTDQFVDSPGATRWRNRRFGIPLDPDGVRHDHRTEAAPPPPEAPPGGEAERPPGTGDRADAFLPANVARMYGHLPAATQSFQCDPFSARGARPAESDVFATIHADDRERRETYWAYMFDARWVTFAHARRSVPVGAGRRGRGRHLGRRRQAEPPSAEGLDTAEWKVAAWAAPVLRPGRAVSVR